jgi:hypothetical protein
MYNELKSKALSREQWQALKDAYREEYGRAMFAWVDARAGGVSRVKTNAPPYFLQRHGVSFEAYKRAPYTFKIFFIVTR